MSRVIVSFEPHDAELCKVRGSLADQYLELRTARSLGDFDGSRSKHEYLISFVRLLPMYAK